MKLILKHWYLVVILLTALVITEQVVQWALAVIVGGYSIGDGFKDAFDDFTLYRYAFLGVIRIVPYAVLGGILFGLSHDKKSKAYVLPVFIGGFIGVLGMMLWGFWTAQESYYTDAHTSSTTALAFLFIPILALLTGGAGAALAALLYHFFGPRRKAVSGPPMAVDISER